MKDENQFKINESAICDLVNSKTSFREMNLLENDKNERNPNDSKLRFI